MIAECICYNCGVESRIFIGCEWVCKHCYSPNNPDGGKPEWKISGTILVKEGEENGE